MRRIVEVAFVTLALAGCAHRSASPPAQPTALLSPDTEYALDEGARLGVEVVGTAEIVPNDLDRPGYPALQVRLTLINDGAGPLTLEPHRQVARLDGAPSLPSDVSEVPFTVEPGQTRALDLFYPMPRPDYGPSLPRSAAFEWQVQLPSGTIARHTTRFNRSTTYGWLPRTTF